MNYLIVFLGAGIGGTCRHGVNVAAARAFGTGFPVGTLAVNVAGSLVMGLLIGWFAHRADPGAAWRLLLTTGFLGGFTTFSAFSLDVAVLWERGAAAAAAGYVALSVVLSIAGLFAGMHVVRSLG
jgi:CrcB protein